MLEDALKDFLRHFPALTTLQATECAASQCVWTELRQNSDRLARPQSTWKRWGFLQAMRPGASGTPVMEAFVTKEQNVIGP